MADTHSSNFSKYTKLRQENPNFVYDSFLIEKRMDGYYLQFHFSINDSYHFYPEHFIPINMLLNADNVSDEVLQTLVFHIGMVELISYWKTACPPKVIIKHFYLDKEALTWWKKLYFHGLGEFFFLNGIEPDYEDFMDIVCESDKQISRFSIKKSDVCIVPVGGGKDSVVTLEILKKSIKLIPFVINSRGATRNTLERAGIDKGDCVLPNRSIDPLLLKMNADGFLNGHTPFSALLAFESVLVAYLCGVSDVALSNEFSANESTVPGSKVNHQYSKSLEFESDFRWYVHKYLSTTYNYFSFLRPLDEMHIALLFSRFTHHHYSFRSCNAGSKNDSWCGKCPKCLFTWIILSPFIPEATLREVFGKNLWEDESLSGLLEQLCGIQSVKPFECVGTRNEVILSLDEIIRQKIGIELPFLLLHYLTKRSLLSTQESIQQVLGQTHKEHYLPASYHAMLMKELSLALHGYSEKI